MADSKKAELTTTSGREMPVATKELVDQAYAAIIDGTLPPEVGDPEVTARAIKLQLASAERFEEVFRAQSLPGWSQELLDVPVIIYGFHLNPSSFDESTSSVYAVVELVAGDDGEIRSYSCGGENVLVQLVKAWEKGWFPFKARLTSKPTGTKGRSVFWLEAA